MIRKLLLVIIAMFTVSGLWAQSGTLQGKVTDTKGEPMAFANISIEQDGKVITGGMTDFDGNFTIKPVPVGKFTVKCSTVGYNTSVLTGVQINNSKITFQNFKLATSVNKLDEVVVTSYKVPLIAKDQLESGGTVTQEDIDKMPGRSASAVAATVGGVNADANGDLNVRGQRSGGTVYYIDGVKVMGNTLPKSAIEQISVIAGGLEAKYGDATGGIINITTKGASKEFHGGVELLTSQFLDPYGFSLGGLTLTGPIYSKKSVDRYDSTKVVKKPIIGFLLTGEITYAHDVSPQINGAWMSKDGVNESIRLTPYTLDQSSGGTPIINYTTDYLQSDNFEHVDALPNNSSLSVNANGKISFNITDNLIFSVGGRYRYLDRSIFSIANSLYNSENNGQYNYNNWQVNGRITHKLSNKSGEEEEKSASTIKNVYYELVGSYEKEYQKFYDSDFDDDLFKYGHVGTFKTYSMPTYEYTTQLEGYSHGIFALNGSADTAVTFAPSQYNPDLANYTKYYYTLFEQGSVFYRNMELIEAFGGVLNGKTPNSIYSRFNSLGTPYSKYIIQDEGQYTFNGNASADIGKHEFQFGFEFEQRDNRYYGAAPIGLWTRARQLANYHISELDLSNPIRHSITDVDGNVILMDTISYNFKYSADAQTMFDYKFRAHLAEQGIQINGQNVTVNGTQQLDIDSYDPSLMSIDYFSADELLNEGNSSVTYYGYDAYGNRLTTNPSIDDFFNETNELGYKTRPVGAFTPNYLAFYVQDKFAFDDLLFRVGLRADRYDANQKVLSDPYSLYKTMTVADLKSSSHADLLNAMPSNIGDDYVVYANSTNSSDATSVLGYRTGTNPAEVKWYNASGTLIDDPKEISAATGISPLLVNSGEQLNSSAFEDYVPQWNFMPRIAFSFPISDVAQFTAHYDVMTKRPLNNRLNLINYLHLQSVASDGIGNPNLLPEKTIELELGFQQKVSNTSSIKLVAFYREMNNLEQVQSITGGYPMDYITYQNIDFGTVKGLTATYDLRRTGNVRMTFAYTLQFANGTGSDAQTALNLIKQGEPNLRQTLPLAFDQRHTLKSMLDYSYLSDELYDGPVLFGRDILENTGVTFIFMYNTGSPYSRKDPNTDNLVGSVNGSRMPSVFRTDMKIYKDIFMKVGKDKKNDLALQIYLDVANLFNAMSVASVFSYTGNANSDAYLTTAKNQSEINAQIDAEAYRNYYSMNISMYDMYLSPRTIRLGLQLGF